MEAELPKISAEKFVSKVEELEQIVIALWTNENTEVEDYTYDRKAAGNVTVSDFLSTRIIPKIGNEISVRIIDGNYGKPHGGRTLRTLRESYVEKS